MNLERFPDLHPALDSQCALTEANRCLYCFDAPCTAACPTHIDVPRFIKKISNGNLRGSANTIPSSDALGWRNVHRLRLILFRAAHRSHIDRIRWAVLHEIAVSGGPLDL